MKSRHVLTLFIFLFAADATNSQTCANGEKRLHAEDECIPQLLFNYLYCLQSSGGGKVEVIRKDGDENSPSSEINFSGKGSGVVIKGEGAVGFKHSDVTKATRELQEKLNPALADKCERIANEILSTPPPSSPTPKAPVANVAPVAPVGRVAVNPLNNAAPKLPEPHVQLETALNGFSCQVASYGNQWAEQNRKRIEDDLYKIYGCSEPPEASNKPGFSGNFHTPASNDGPWSGFASQSTVLYYDPNNKSRAAAVARDLSQRYQHKFVIARGAGQGIPYEWFSRTIVVHLRETGA
ncbi:hypothetical protein [Variovorax sp. LG9.2]|uniref:hypothetical protein n=1 Tax=Variovorax sp. LG9.2 TaxID=3048626 RepID=UPI002B231576|nr:hypothetical protein [Variovorax sp. LG9.2]MEB0060141.1 hypothetical protein [Variovorax sp. LG9.2]